MKPEHYPQQPAEIWRHFYAISQIPRPSGSEAAMRDYIVKLAAERGCSQQSDGFGNLVVYVPATEGRDKEGAVIIQNHLDMVTVKAAAKDHDFSTDALSLQVSDGWLSADQTTLGADNGIGVAAALALLTDAAVSHPPLELLFTVEEETGLYGASALDASLLSGQKMLNLDTEDWGEFFIGCTGARGWRLTRPLEREADAGSNEQASWRLSLAGLSGGHSGIQINEQLGNAIKLLADWLACLPDATGVRLTRFSGGTAHNVIPAEASLEFVCEPGSEPLLLSHNAAMLARWRGYLPAADQGLELTLSAATAGLPPLRPAEQQLLTQWLQVFPHGVLSYAREQDPELAQLSINLAVVDLDAERLAVESTLRFFNSDQADALERQVLALAGWLQAEVVATVNYPGWEPRLDGPLLALAQQLYTEIFGTRAAVKAIHAGLECGIIQGKLPGVDILSFGPTIRGAHSPTERLEIATVKPFWELLVALLRKV